MPVKIKGLQDHVIVKLAASNQSAALSRKGQLLIWGTGTFGEFLVPKPFTKSDLVVADVSLGGQFGAFLDSNGFLWTWGSNDHGELGSGNYESRQ